MTAMMVLACANMVFRAVWIPIKGNYELLGFFGAVMTAFGMGFTQKQKGHIALTIFSGVLPRRVEKIIDALGYAAACIFFSLIAWRSAMWALRLAESGELSETLRFAYYPFPLAMAFGILVLALNLLCDLVSTFQHKEKQSS